tara:strand:- start:570 stop:788 length:219 start_codon:yes stop_codon:yes gene_type:complete
MNYIEEQTDKLAKQTLDSSDGTMSIATSTPGYGWDGKLHAAMPHIARKLEKRGFSVTSQHRFEVTDWRIFKV